MMRWLPVLGATALLCGWVFSTRCCVGGHKYLVMFCAWGVFWHTDIR